MECRLWDAVLLARPELSGTISEALGGVPTATAPQPAPLVPVRLLPISGSHLQLRSATETHLRSGILMSAYAYTGNTLCTLREAVSVNMALQMHTRMLAALNTMHACGWMHGDVKPSNIFFDAAGTPFLGDYGSSTPLTGLTAFTGGTELYQCAEVAPADEATARSFDYVGLALTLLVMRRRLDPTDSAGAWSPAAVTAALDAEDDPDVRLAISNLLPF